MSLLSLTQIIDHKTIFISSKAIQNRLQNLFCEAKKASFAQAALILSFLFDVK